MKQVFNLTMLLCSVSFLAGCAASQSQPEPGPESQFYRQQFDSAEIPETQSIKPRSIDDMLVDLSIYQKAQRPEFTFGKGDVLSVSVYGEEELSADLMPVRPDGKISFPLIGDIQAEGRKVKAVSDEIRTKLGRYIREPRVAVIVREFNSLSYTIAGEVIRPGNFPLSTDVTLAQAVARAGGLAKGHDQATSIELADLTHAFVSRDGEYLPIDFVQLFRNGDMRFDIQLFPSDYIYIPSGLAKEVFIVGEVNTPDLFAFSEGTTVVNAITYAQGFTPDADLSRVHVVRGSLTNPELFVMNLNQVLEGKERDILLQSGDVVYIPPTGLTVWNRILTKLIPSVSALQTGLILERTTRGR